MRIFLLVLLVLGVAFVWQRQKQLPPVEETPSAHAVVEMPQTSPRPVSEHNWAKRSLDRTNEVADQVRKSRQENQP